MPRGPRRTASGAAAQKIKSVEGQRYGEGVAQQDMQQAMPAPDFLHRTLPPTADSPSPAPASVDGLMAAAAAVSASGGGLLTQPSARPNEPVTAGLPIGPGAGPEALPRFGGSPGGRFLRELAAATGNDYFAQLADRTGA